MESTALTPLADSSATDLSTDKETCYTGTEMSDKASLKMVTCGCCDTKVFIPGDLPPLGSVPCSKCGNPIMMPMMLRQFELRNVIASGGMGTVYRSYDTVLQRMVAVKLMKKELLNDAEALENFYREARACAGLNHTNIIHIYT